MDFDHIVIGSGLAALGTIIGLPEHARVLVVGGAPEGRFSYYDERRTVPSAYLGLGGLGNDWHGVIPTGWFNRLPDNDDAGFETLFRRFYPATPLDGRLGGSRLFIPWRPIRPRRELPRLAAQRQPNLQLVHRLVRRMRLRDDTASVELDDGSMHSAPRVWMAAGALHTPGLLEEATGHRLARGQISDHVLCYVGQTDGLPGPEVTRTRDGLWLQAWVDAAASGLYTLRPARFAFRQLDHGIEQRAVFGLPTGSAVRKIMRRASPGLLAEAFFNRFGIGGQASRHSVYAQVEVADAYEGDAQGPLRARQDVIRRQTDRARERTPFPGIVGSRMPDVHLPGIHLHHSLDLPAVQAAGINLPGAPVQVVDASLLKDIGCEHHSFKMMLAAERRARRA